MTDYFASRAEATPRLARRPSLTVLGSAIVLSPGFRFRFAG
ncbi:MAG: hypothetical protein P9M08_04030 [Candidatus Erginobacter occultus]|nr:hypothetical protein [Candidatus Erginobacter occultus]